jgi:hypothetical protein
MSLFILFGQCILYIETWVLLILETSGKNFIYRLCDHLVTLFKCLGDITEVCQLQRR